MTRAETPSRSPVRFEALWLALHFGVAMAAGDLLINIYHNQAGLRYLRYIVPPALAAGACGAAVFLFATGLLRLASNSDDRGRRAERTALGLALGGILLAFQWGEATPSVYIQLARGLTFANLAVAAATHAFLSFRLDAGGRARAALIAGAGLTYAGTAINLFDWFYITRIEEWVGYEGSIQVERGIVAFGLFTFTSGLSLLASQAARLVETRRVPGTLARIFLTPLPYAAITAAVLLWSRWHQAEAQFPASIQRLAWVAPALALIALAGGALQTGARGLRLPGALGVLTLLAGFGLCFRGPIAEKVGLKTYTAPDRPLRRVILVTSDTLRSDALEIYGGKEIATPHLTALAEESVVFDEAIAPGPWTLPSFAGMLTGLYPGVFGSVGLRWRMGEEVESLAERMAAAGFYTGAVGMNPLLRPQHGLDQGFETYEFYPAERRSRTLGTRLIYSVRPDFFKVDLTSSELKDRALEWVAANRDKDFFFWLHIWDPHTPLGPPPEFRPEGRGPATIAEPWERSLEIKSGAYKPNAEEREWLRRLYLGEIRYMDHCVGQLMEGLKELGLFDDTLVVFASDHGEEFWDHKKYGHGHTLYRELVHVPLVVKLPGRTAAGRVTQPVSIASLTPTVLDFAGVAFDPAEFSVPSIGPLCRDPKAELETMPVFSETYGDHRWAVRFGDLMFLTVHDDSRPPELYDETKDPGERENLAGARPAEVEEARRLLEDYHARNLSLRAFHQIEEKSEVEFFKEELGNLQKLGYIE